jgi:hypothetical protein
VFERRSGGGGGGKIDEKNDKADTRPPPPPPPPKPPTDHWIAIVLKDDHDVPVAGAAYKITLPDGKVSTGVLDADGTARLRGITPGSCKVTFPDIDAREWKLA